MNENLKNKNYLILKFYQNYYLNLNLHFIHFEFVIFFVLVSFPNFFLLFLILTPSHHRLKQLSFITFN